jgi:hypothetical protein
MDSNLKDRPIKQKVVFINIYKSESYLSSSDNAHGAQ